MVAAHTPALADARLNAIQAMLAVQRSERIKLGMVAKSRAMQATVRRTRQRPYVVEGRYSGGMSSLYSKVALCIAQE